LKSQVDRIKNPNQPIQTEDDSFLKLARLQSDSKEVICQ